MRQFNGIATPAVRTLINEASPPVGTEPGNRHETLKAIVFRLAHDGWNDDSIRRFVPVINVAWGDGDWSGHLDRLLAWVRAREGERAQAT
jgi:hypothetical protein